MKHDREGRPESVDSPAAPPPPAAAIDRFGAGLEVATAYATLLCTTGIEHGLIGPRERDRIWERHLLNCAVVADLIPQGADVADVGSGAGLPGIVLAIVRPDLAVTLVEPLERRVRWLSRTVEQLALGNVAVERARAESVAATFDVVTARAVAALPTLARWCLPLVRPEGALLALKGSSAADELERSRRDLAGLGAGPVDLVEVTVAPGLDPVRVVRVHPGRPRDRGRPPRAGTPRPGTPRGGTARSSARRAR